MKQLKIITKSYSYVFILIFFFSLFSITEAQYLRDKTNYINLDNYYPTDFEITENYNSYKIYSLTYNNIFDIPEVEVKFQNNSYPLKFDFGNNHNIIITSELKKTVDYNFIDSSFTYNPDGSIRDKVLKIVIPYFNVFDTDYYNEESVLVDWNTFSTNPFNGLIGLKYLADKSFTLDNESKQLIISSESIAEKIDSNKAVIIDLLNFAYHPYGIHFVGEINNKKRIFYFDTGKSQSALNRDLFPNEKILTDKSGSFYDGKVNISFGKINIDIEYPRVKSLKRNIENNYEMGIEIGIDILKYFLISVDRTNNKNIMIIHIDE